jgi:demethylmenaquinone methyltransferase/2-methoxy-6-polyprenyl-1,4-benzoquinol methylase
LHPSRLFFEHLAQEWDDLQPPGRQAILNQLISRCDTYLEYSDLILEVGSGTGGFIPVLEKRYPSSKIVSIDFATAMLLRSRKHHNGHHLVQADVHELPFPSGKFSAVICHNSFPHFKDKTKALEEMRRVLRQGGTLLILHELGRQKVNAIHQNARAVEIHRDLLPSGDALSALLVRSGFHPTIIEDIEQHYIACAKV